MDVEKPLSKRTLAHLSVEPGKKVNLEDDFDPGWLDPDLDRTSAETYLASSTTRLADLQTRLFAEGKHSVLLVLQAIDAAGKDGTVGHVMSGVNPQGVSVTSFKVPSSLERSHDYLWRYHAAIPARGRIGIFNRSYYEEVLVTKVHPELLDAEGVTNQDRHDVIERRYREINDFERYLTDNGTTIVKIFLNLSKDEQRRRFLRRIDDPKRNWKFEAGDIAEREHWDDYQDAFSAMLSATSTDAAPWFVIPADHKWFARLATSTLLCEAIERLRPAFPTIDADARAEMARLRVGLSDES